MDRDTYWVLGTELRQISITVRFASVAACAAGVCVTVTRTTRLLD